MRPKFGQAWGQHCSCILHFESLIHCGDCIKAINGHFSDMDSQHFLELQLFEHVTFVEGLHSNTCSFLVI